MLGSGAAEAAARVLVPQRARARGRRRGAARRVRARRRRVRILGRGAAPGAHRRGAMGGNVRLARDVAPHLKWIQLTSAGADRLLNSGFIAAGRHRHDRQRPARDADRRVRAQRRCSCSPRARRSTMRAQLKHEWSRFAPRELYGKTVGIVGLGHIGAEVGRLAKAFGCRVIATKRSTTETHRAPVRRRDPAGVRAALACSPRATTSCSACR